MAEKPTPVPGPQVRLLALDVDGTLTNATHTLTATTCAAIAAVRRSGIRVILATGRRYRDTLPVAAALGLDGPLITASGALVKRVADHRTLFRAAFEPGVLEGVVALVVSSGHEPVVYSDSFARGFDFHCRGLPSAPAAGPTAGTGPTGLAEYLDRNRTVARITPDLVERPPDGVFAGFAMGSRERMLALEAALDAAFPDRLSLHTIRSPRYRDWMCEIAPAGVTKWSGVRAIADAWGITAPEICAVGDDVNDLPMIRHAGLGIAMGNAPPEVRAVADRVVGDHDDDGLVQVAEMLLG